MFPHLPVVQNRLTNLVGSIREDSQPQERFSVLSCGKPGASYTMSRSVVAAALACVLITCAVDLDLDHTEHHSKTIELGTPQARTDSTLPAEFSGRAKESATDAVALRLSLPPSLSLSRY